MDVQVKVSGLMGTVGSPRLWMSATWAIMDLHRFGGLIGFIPVPGTTSESRPPRRNRSHQRTSGRNQRHPIGLPGPDTKARRAFEETGLRSTTSNRIDRCPIL